MKTHCRCRSCGARRVLRKHPTEYTRQPKCGTCGARNYRADLYRMAGKDDRPTCHADCYHFPHRIGSGQCKFLKPGVYKP